MVVLALTIASRLFSENLFDIRTGWGYSDNILRNSDSLGSGFINLNFSDYFIFDNSSFALITDNNIKVFTEESWSSNSNLLFEIDYNFENSFIGLGVNKLIDNNDRQNSFYSLFLISQYSYKIFDISYILSFKNFSEEYEYGSFKNSISKNRQPLKKRSKEVNFIDVNQEDFNHILSLEVNLDNVKFTPLIEYNKSNVSRETYFLYGLSSSYSKQIDRVLVDFLLSYNSYNYTKIDRDDNLFKVAISAEYMLGKLLSLTLSDTFEKNISDFDGEDYNANTIMLNIGLVY